jgi:hypothetical protein
VQIKPCGACAAGLLATDKFCRWCGVRQPGELLSTADTAGGRNLVTQLDYRTTPLSRDLYHPVSGPLLNAVTHGVARRARSGFTRGIIQALISVPVWMIIVLLSPLDAYASAKILSGRL